MKYRIVSPLVGTPGEIYNPPVVVNLQALINGGFIVPDTDEPTTADEKPARTKAKKAEQE